MSNVKTANRATVKAVKDIAENAVAATVDTLAELLSATATVETAAATVLNNLGASATEAPPAFIPPEATVTPVTTIARRAAGSAYPMQATIVCKIPNPKRPGTVAYDAWIAYGTPNGGVGQGVKVGAYLATRYLPKGRAAAALAWDLARGFISFEV